MVTAMRLVQLSDGPGYRAGISHDGLVRVIEPAITTLEIVKSAAAAGRPLLQHLAMIGKGAIVTYDELAAAGRIRPPIDHPEPSRFLVTGTGLTHIGSAETRDRMHRVTHADEAGLSDSMKMFRMGIAGGKPADPAAGGAQPEWFYKGNGYSLVAPGEPLSLPAFCRVGGEEPEIVTLHWVHTDGTVWRVGYVLGNDFTDHELEQTNYLYLAHSKLLPFSLGPELYVGDFPEEIRGTSRILREGRPYWERPFLSGRRFMCHSLENLEHHHFKYPQHRIANTLHAHFLGCPVMAFGEGVRAQPGDEFEVHVPDFGAPLRNRLEIRELPRPAIRPVAGSVVPA